ncbi:MAG TPA: sigma-54 dependent transcriptional regulator, partial [bacterium]|nr:sigma-54 dependent transcriptional regulator [bacterium]
HYHSDRNANPFITVNCNAIPDTLLESELFGHKKGSFTGAHADKIGLFEAADNGVIFLDEIGDISPTLQVKLLRVIEDKKIMRIGEVTSKKINVRIIAATNKDIEVEVKNGRFREDLFYRLNIIRIHLPPLRERGDDILMIANFFLENFKNQFNKLNIIGFSKDAIKEINNYSWPGNIRELENILKRAVILTENNEITASDLFGNIVNKFSYIKQSKIEEEDLIGDGIDLNEILEDLEKQYIIAALKKANNNQTEAAKLLNINRTTLLAKIRKYSI